MGDKHFGHIPHLIIPFLYLRGGKILFNQVGDIYFEKRKKEREKKERGERRKKDEGGDLEKYWEKGGEDKEKGGKE